MKTQGKLTDNITAATLAAAAAAVNRSCSVLSLDC